MLIPADLKTSGNCKSSDGVILLLFYQSCEAATCIEAYNRCFCSFLRQFVVTTQTDITTDRWREGRRDRCIKIQID